MSAPHLMLAVRSAPLRIFAAAFALAGPALSARAERLVTVRATADTGYAQQRAASHPPPAETYIFAKGQYFPGITHDSTLDKMPFEKIVQTLAFDLQRQNYVPTKSLETADLLIVVHWGVTIPNDRGADLMAFNLDSLRQSSEGVDRARQTISEDVTGELTGLGIVEAAETAFRSTLLATDMMYQGDDLRAHSNAEMLGFQSALTAESKSLFDTEEARTLRAMIDEERYFLVMIAYDARKFREGKKRKLWVSRLSARSAGVNFRIAMDRMSNAGGKFFGTRQPDLAIEYLKERTGVVKVGDLKVIEEPKPAK
jgi:ribosomal protein L20